MSRIEISGDVLFQEVDGEMVLLDLEGETYYGLDSTGTRVWRLVEKGTDRGQIVEALSDVYDVPREQLERDVGTFLDELAEAGLIREC